MVKTLITLRHMRVKEFGVQFYHEKAFRDLGAVFVMVQYNYCKNNKNLQQSITY